MVVFTQYGKRTLIFLLLLGCYWDVYVTSSTFAPLMDGLVLSPQESLGYGLFDRRIVNARVHTNDHSYSLDPACKPQGVVYLSDGTVVRGNECLIITPLDKPYCFDQRVSARSLWEHKLDLGMLNKFEEYFTYPDEFLGATLTKCVRPDVPQVFTEEYKLCPNPYLTLGGLLPQWRNDSILATSCELPYYVKYFISAVEQLLNVLYTYLVTICLMYLAYHADHYVEKVDHAVYQIKSCTRIANYLADECVNGLRVVGVYCSPLRLVRVARRKLWLWWNGYVGIAKADEMLKDVLDEITSYECVDSALDRGVISEESFLWKGGVLSLQDSLIGLYESGRSLVDAAKDIKFVAASELIPLVSRGEVLFDNTKHVNKAHRRLRKGCEAPFLRAVIADCKVRFGLPEDNSANRLCVHKWAGDKMREHGLRPTHIARHLPQVVSMVFVPSVAEIEAKQIERKSTIVADRWYDFHS